MDIEELSKKIDTYHKEEKRRSEEDRWRNFTSLALVVALAILSNYIATKNLIHVWFTIGFFIIALFSWLYTLLSPKFKNK